jgi:hypothetical protein
MRERAKNYLSRMKMYGWRDEAKAEKGYQAMT